MFSRRRPLRLAAVEGGGTTFVVGIADGTAANIVERAEFPTTTPEETLGRCAEWLAARDYDALGVACFGPLDLRKESRMYGHITTTPKPGWQFADVLGPLCRVRPNVPVALDTDVNAPALAEYRHAAAAALAAGQPKPTSSAYVTVGTGIGVGLVVNCEPVHGLMHPEGGHVSVPRLASDSGFPGSNPKDTFNGNCIENLTCSHSLAKRAGLSDPSELRALPDDHQVWAAAAHYLGVLCANITLMVSPEKIVLSGGIMQRDSLWPNVRREAQAALNGYIQLEELQTAAGLESYIVPSTWGNSAGLVGALTLAQLAADSERGTPISSTSRIAQLAAVAGAMAAAALVVTRRI